VDETEAAGVECLCRNVLRVHHAGAGLEVARLVHGGAQVIADQFDRVLGIAQ